MRIHPFARLRPALGILAVMAAIAVLAAPASPQAAGCAGANTDTTGLALEGVQPTVQNLFDRPYRSFVRVPTIGRLALLRVSWEF